MLSKITRIPARWITAGLALAGLCWATRDGPLFVVGIVALTLWIAWILHRIGCVFLARRLARRRIKALLAPHLETLARRRLVLIRCDVYGVVDRRKWDKELDHVANAVITPALSPADQAYFQRNRAVWIASLIDAPAARRAAALDGENTGTGDLSPTDYEAFCGKLLEKQGWKIDLTAASGDQGADIIARKNGLTLAVQCKKYSKPVGNRAVQEISAATRHYRADRGAVVSNAGYTNAARALARSNRTLLLHHGDLPDIDQLLATRPE